MNRESVNEMISRTETPLFWVGAFTVACVTLWLLYRLLTGFRIWILGNGQLLTPRLGRWAGESALSNYFPHATCSYMAVTSPKTIAASPFLGFDPLLQSFPLWRRLLRSFSFALLRVGIGRHCAAFLQRKAGGHPEWLLFILNATNRDAVQPRNPFLFRYNL
ncbi:hypothetical protein GOODEAATRI_006847 [Goodea atripinnis]|uniref:Uncharacterized protein n=1 Tax=Goodea atripinnis TaxID=208336 RepID=A0ABV0PVW4_9TELE